MCIVCSFCGDQSIVVLRREDVVVVVVGYLLPITVVCDVWLDIKGQYIFVSMSTQKSTQRARLSGPLRTY